MIIQRILNNNVAIILDENGNEQVVCGKGIAYNKKNGDLVDKNQINKIFVLSNNEFNQKFQDMFSEIPYEHMQLAFDIIGIAKLQLGKKINENVLIILSDHIYSSIKRYSEGITVKNVMIWDIKRFYETEFEIGMRALDLIEKRFNIRLPEDEAGFIALHIVNAEMEDSDIHQVMEITTIMQELSNIVKYYFKVEFDTSSAYYYRFITHLKFFAQRVVSGKLLENLETQDDLLGMVKVKYSTSFKCVEKIGKFIIREYGYIISNEEKLYLTIHIERVIYKTKK